MGLVNLVLTLFMPTAVGKVLPKHRRIERIKLTTKAWLYDVFLAAAVSVVFITAGSFYEHMDAKPNFFQELGLPRGSTRPEIRKHWKNVILTHHPDKVHDPAMKADAEMRFNDLKTMYETLLNDDERWVYDRLGDNFFSRPDHLEAKDSVAAMCFYHLPEYVILLLVAYAYGSSPSRKGARDYVVIGMLLVLVWEIMITYGDGWWEPPLWFINPFMTAADKVSILRMLLPCIMHSLYAVADGTFIDIGEHRHLQVLHRQNLILSRLDEEPWYNKKTAGKIPEPTRSWKKEIELLKRGEEELIQKELELRKRMPGGGGLSMGSMIQLAFLVMMIYNALQG